MLKLVKELFNADQEGGGVFGTLVLMTVCALMAVSGWLLAEKGAAIVASNRRPYYREEVEYKYRMVGLKKDVLKALSKTYRTMKMLPAQIDLQDAEALAGTEHSYLVDQYSEVEQVLYTISEVNRRFDSTERGKALANGRNKGKALIVLGRAVLFPSVFFGIVLTVQLVILPFSLISSSKP